jgi:ATP-binding cassette, subfamily B, bacterial
MMSWIGERVTADLRRAVYAHVLRQSPQFFETLKTGEVLSRLTADATVIQDAVGSNLSMGLRSLVMALGAIGMLVATNPRLMLAVVGVITLIVLPALGIGRRVRRLSRASQDRIADEVLNAVPVVQSCTQENAETLRFARSNEIAVATAVRRAGIRAGLTAFLITGVIGGRLSAGELSQTALYIMIVASSVAVLAEVWGGLLRTAGATERLMELLAARSPIADPPHPRELPAGRGTQPLRVEFVGVSFRYPSRPAVPVLQDLDFVIEQGQTVALVGASGAGKTTVFLLLQRFYDIDAGQLTLDGAQAAPRRPARVRRHGAAGAGDFLRDDPRQHSLRAPERERRAGTVTACGQQAHKWRRSLETTLEHFALPPYMAKQWQDILSGRLKCGG